MKSNWKRYFKNEGGFKLISSYLKNGTFFTSLMQFVILGRDKKALEILRLSSQYKLLNNIIAKNKSIINSLRKDLGSQYATPTNQVYKHVWICWWQGIENAPDIVKQCYRSVIEHLSDWKVNVITKDNFNNYITFPDYIINKWNNGVISNTHVSDLLRLELLTKHGGLWLDATILVTSGSIPSSIINSDLFFYQTLKPGADGHAIPFSNWLIYSKPSQPILIMTLRMLYRFWKTNDKIIDYYLFHYYLTIACREFPDMYDRIPKYSNEPPHILLLSLFNTFDRSYWNDLKTMTCFHKLSYKFDTSDINEKDNTYYSHIMNL